MIRPISIILICLILFGCKRVPKELALIDGEWNIEIAESNGKNLLKRSLDPNKSNFYVAPYFHIFLENNTFLIEEDAYDEIYHRAKFEIKRIDKKIVVNVIKSNNPKLIGRYVVKIDTLKPNNDGNEMYRIYLQSQSAKIVARKTVVNSILK